MALLPRLPILLGKPRANNIYICRCAICGGLFQEGELHPAPGANADAAYHFEVSMYSSYGFVPLIGEGYSAGGRVVNELRRAKVTLTKHLPCRLLNHKNSQNKASIASFGTSRYVHHILMEIACKVCVARTNPNMDLECYTLALEFAAQNIRTVEAVYRLGGLEEAAQFAHREHIRLRMGR